jgi:hypothetical protein
MCSLADRVLRWGGPQVRAGAGSRTFAVCVARPPQAALGGWRSHRADTESLAHSELAHPRAECAELRLHDRIGQPGGRHTTWWIYRSRDATNSQFKAVYFPGGRYIEA